ncbi:SDR family oxidoreductase [Candidatus Pelagisphaera phototrophica]|uniref:SDR family oxidoreductase n=1 Tax=Candidatus Pelagisphaera phototrophica TaxID=2684113 RepID=UPI0019F9E07C|nr:SDR family oxidoreductase [Candidatus Pelagisphaera phototrophica]QXD30847.1 SDR family oxidoreductase [Candidatus Pelagisphaera phototrophica]
MSKHVCITGCTKGLGLALAKWFYADGWRVSGIGRNQFSIDSLQSQGNGYFRAVDVTDDNTLGFFASELADQLGTPDLLVNNAGVINANAPLWEVPPEVFAKVVDINIKGVYHTIRHFAPLMIARGSGIMINLSSGWGRSTSAEVAPYCATKWAIEGLSQAMARELPDGVAIAAMNPGIIDTDMLRSCLGSDASRFGNTTQWAERTGPYLAGLDASINGQALTAP